MRLRVSYTRKEIELLRRPLTAFHSPSVKTFPYPPHSLYTLFQRCPQRVVAVERLQTKVTERNMVVEHLGDVALDRIEEVFADEGQALVSLIAER